jgi:hypothetical protein
METQKVRKVILSYRCVTIREVAEEGGISKATCHEIPTENLSMHCVAAKYVPRLLRVKIGNKIVLIPVKNPSTVHMLNTF